MGAGWGQHPGSHWCRAAAKRFGVSGSAAIKLMQRYRTTGRLVGRGLVVTLSLCDLMICNQWVGGSSPSAGTNKIKDLA